MEMRHLAYVEAIARLGSFTRAANELHVAQPAVSAQVADLERRLGTALFTRTPAGAVPTEAGQLVADLGRHVHASVEETIRDLNNLHDLLRGTVTIGATPLLGPVDLPAITALFHARHPAVQVRIRTALIGPLIDELHHGRVDLVIGPLDPAHPIDPTRVRSTVLREESLSLITSPDQPAASLNDARDRPFVCLPDGSGLRRLLHAACLHHHFTPSVDIEVTDPRDIPSYVAAGLGAALVATSIAQAQAPGSVHALVLQDLAHPPIGLITSLHPSAATRELAAQLIQTNARPSAGTIAATV